MSVRGETIAVLGGDRRMAEAVRFFQKSGAQIRVAGLAVDPQFADVQECPTAADALSGADFAVLPVQGVGEDGKVFTLKGVPDLYIDSDCLRRMNKKARIFVGIGNEYLRGICEEVGVPLVEYREADEFAIWNSIPSAEGGIQMAMEATPFTLFGSRSLVLGFGRTGKALALLLKGIFSDVTVAVRKELDLAKVWAAGYRQVQWDRLPDAVAEADVIFNTVPAMVLPREVLRRAPSHAVIIDLASVPGGTDFEAAEELGLTAKLAPGLPGIVAPVTAGMIIADMILRHLNRTQGEEGDR